MNPFKQAYVVTTENGAASLVVVAAYTHRDGRAMAKDAAAKAEQCAAWDICAFPTEPNLAEGVTRLFIA